MIRNLQKLSKGQYVADFRYDEGIRIREDFVSPCLLNSLGTGKTLSGSIYYIEVKEVESNDDDKI